MTADEVGDGQRPCARGQHCKSATVSYDDHGNPHREPALGPRAFCELDRGEISRAVAKLPERYIELALRLGDKTSSDGLRVSGGGSSAPVPIRLDIEALMVQIVSVVASWEARVAEVARLTGVQGRPERRGSAEAGVALTRMCRTLSAHLDALLALQAWPMARFVGIKHAGQLAEQDVTGLVHPAAGYAEVNRDLGGADAGLELLALDRRCRRVLGWTPQHERLPVPCWECGNRAVLRLDGGAGLEDRAECFECGEVYEEERFTLLMSEVESAARGKKPASNHTLANLN